MKFKYIFIISILMLSIVGASYYFYVRNNHSKENLSKNGSSQNGYNTAKVGLNEKTSQDNASNNNSEKTQNNTTDNSIEDNSDSKVEEDQKNSYNKGTETEISSFSTKIYTKDSERQNNVSITCNTLNDTIVENGKTFSFCNTVGKATSSKGYQKADVFKDGEKVKALGGGNCQVSSTLYNAVLEIQELKVTERHAHSNSVPYVKKGKDAAVAYGTYDFKFINNTRK